MSSSAQTGLTIVGAGIGAAVFGPMGAMYGAAIGYTLGMSTLSTTLPPTDGPRLSDLNVQANTYGWNIPRSFGTTGHNGALIWSSGIRETRHTQRVEQGGKGAQPTTQQQNTYTYDVSFAILFHDGEIKAVRRVYANEFLIYDAGDFSEFDSMTDGQLADWITTKLQGLGDNAGDMTIYRGTETQTPDPTMQSYDGVGNVPGYRGYAYLVFNNIQLAKFGNRIPQIRIEYIATVDDPNTANSLVKTVDYSSFTYGNDLSDRFPTIDGDGIVHMFVAEDTGANPLKMQYFKLLPTGSLSYVKTVEIDNDVNTHHPHGVAQIPMIFSQNTVSYDVTVYQPNGSLHSPGSSFSFVLDGADFPYVNNYQYQVYSQIGSNIEGKIFYWGNGNTKFRLYHYSKYVDVSILGNSSTEISVWWEDFDVADGTAESGIKGFAASENYLYVVYGNGTIRRYDHGGVLLNTWDQTPDIPITPDRHGVQLDQNNEEILYIESSTNFYRVEDGVFTLISSTFGFDGAVSTWQVYSNMLIMPVSTDNDMLYYSMGDIARTGESLDVVVASLLEEAGLEASDIDVTALSSIVVDGFTKSSVSAPSKSIEILMQAYQFSCYEDENKLIFVLRGEAVDKNIDASHLGAGLNSASDPIYTQERLDDQNMPLVVNVNYINPFKEYDVSTQSSRRSRIYETEQVTDIDIPVVMDADSARRMAEKIQSAIWRARSSFEDIVIPLRYLDITPSDVVDFTVDGIYNRIRVGSLNVGEFIEVSGFAEDTDDYSSIIAGQQQPIVYRGNNNAGTSEYYLIDCPALRNEDGDTGFYVAAHGYLPSWRGCVVYAQSPSGGWSQSAAATNAATVGVALDVMPDADSEVVDYASTLTVRMRSGELSSVTLDAAMADKSVNAALLGDNGHWELLQFLTATDNGDGTYTLSGFIRGQNGTEWAMGEHVVGDILIMLSESTLTRAYTSETGVQYVFRGVSIGNDFYSGEDKLFTNTAEATRPFAPVHLSATDNNNGTYTITWTRRTRTYGEWRDYADVPLSEASESYRVRVYYINTLLSTTTVTAATATVEAVPGYIVKVAQISEYYGAGIEGEVIAGGDVEFARYDPANKSASIALTNDNLTATGTAGAWKSVKADTGVSAGKYYWEVTIDALVNAMVGVGKSGASVNSYCGQDANGWSYGWGGDKWNNAVNTAFGASFTAGDVISVALDITAGKIWFARNGVWQGSGNPSAGTGEAYSGITGPVYPQDSPYSSSGMTANFGQSAMIYTVPTGFAPGVY